MKKSFAHVVSRAHVAIDIDKLYQEQDKDDYLEGIVDIFVAMAAKALSDFTRAKQSPHLMAENSTEYSRKFVEFMKSADDKQRINEYAWLIKGFFEIGQGTDRMFITVHCSNYCHLRIPFSYRVHARRPETRRGPLPKCARPRHQGAGGEEEVPIWFLDWLGESDIFSVCLLNRTFTQLFMLLQLQGLVSYATVRYEAALTHFTRAVSTNPVASGASVRMAVALCFYKLEQYDRARAAIEKCIQLDVRRGAPFVHGLRRLIFLCFFPAGERQRPGADGSGGAGHGDQGQEQTAAVSRECA